VQLVTAHNCAAAAAVASTAAAAAVSVDGDGSDDDCDDDCSPLALAASLVNDNSDTASTVTAAAVPAAPVAVAPAATVIAASDSFDSCAHSVVTDSLQQQHKQSAQQPCVQCSKMTKKRVHAVKLYTTAAKSVRYSASKTLSTEQSAKQQKVQHYCMLCRTGDIEPKSLSIKL
jgi:hypothetical protein